MIILLFNFSFFSVFIFFKRISELIIMVIFMTIYVGNVVTPNMNSEVELVQIPTKITWEKFYDIIEQGGFVNFMGHEDVARIVGLEQNRISISLKDGDVVYIAQYKGPRLAEGQTTLPEGARLIPIKYNIVKKNRISVL